MKELEPIQLLTRERAIKVLQESDHEIVVLWGRTPGLTRDKRALAYRIVSLACTIFDVTPIEVWGGACGAAGIARHAACLVMSRGGLSGGEISSLFLRKERSFANRSTRVAEDLIKVDVGFRKSVESIMEVIGNKTLMQVFSDEAEAKATPEPS